MEKIGVNRSLDVARTFNHILGYIPYAVIRKCISAET